MQHFVPVSWEVVWSSTRRRACPFLAALLAGMLPGMGPAAQATVSYSGWITNLDGTTTYNWNPTAPNGNAMVVGYSGDASLLLNDYFDGNGVTQISSVPTYVAYGEGVRASFTIRGSGSSFPSGNLYVAQGTNSVGTFTMTDGATWIDPTYLNRNIHLGRGVGSFGKMVMADSGTALYLADNVYVGVKDGAAGQLVVESGALCEMKFISIGHDLGAVGEVVVDGPGTILRSWGNTASFIGRRGWASVVVKNAGLAEIRAPTIGASFASYGDVLVTGAGSRFDNVGWSQIQIAVGAGTETGPAVGVLRLARGGVAYSDLGLYVAYGSSGPDVAKGTLAFLIGDDGTGTVAPGRADIESDVRLGQAWLQMEVDPGISLVLGQQFVLVDYLTLGTSSGTQNNRFQDVPEGAVVVSPNHHAFRINYATDLGGGDLAITATVVTPPTADGDGDGLIDAWEIACFGATDNPLGGIHLDPDGDGRNNLAEHAAGTHPLDPASRSVTRVDDPPLGPTWDLVYSPYDPAVTYHVKRTTDLDVPGSTVSPAMPTIDGDTVRFTLPADTASPVFYNVGVER